jgi:DNA repair photolyase
MSRAPPGHPFPAPEDTAGKGSPVRGRGAVGNPAGRHERLVREPVDDGWFGGDGEPPPLKTVVRIEHAKSVIARNDSPDVPFSQSINPYRGCEHGCIYCYARPNHSYLGLSPGIDFETRLFAKTNAPERLRAELASASYRCEPIALGTATDAWQPIEREHRITRSLLEILSETNHPVTVVTKSSRIERDLDLLAPMARRGLASVHVTITTLDAELARRWEPRAAAPWRRLETIRRLAEAGIPVGVSAAPLVPFLNEPELERILTEARAVGATNAFYMILRLPWELREVFVDWLRTHYPDRANRVLNRLSEMRDASGEGRLNDPRFHHRMKGRGNWAALVRLRFELIARKLGLDRSLPTLRTDLFVRPGPAGQMGLFDAGASGPEPR